MVAGKDAPGSIGITHRRVGKIAKYLFLFCFSLRRRKAKGINPTGNTALELSPGTQGIDGLKLGPSARLKV
jgi:hypothetical protein